MSLLTILRYPDPRLNTIAKPVTSVDTRIKTLVADMLETMYHAQGVGLAASQVDIHERVVVIDVTEEKNSPLVLINPEVIWASEEKIVNDEGCLSVPSVYDGVERHTTIQVRALNEHGKEFTLDAANNLLAICIQHEMDHLLGKVFVQYLSPLKRNRIKTKMLKMTKAEREDNH